MGKSLKDVGRKAEKKREHLKGMEYEVTPAQRIMRQEMEAGVHKRDTREDPLKLNAVLDAAIGPVEPDAAIAARAHELIELHGQGLQLGLGQWVIIQRIVEAALKE